MCGRAKRAVGGVGERSEPPAGGLAVGAEGSVNSELIKKVHVDANGSVTEIQFDIKENSTPKNPEEKESKNEDPTSLRKKIQKFFGRK